MGDRNVIKIANDVQKAKGKDQDRVPVSSKWYDGFRKRHPEIQYKKSTNIDYNRVEAASRLKMQKHVRSLMDYHTKMVAEGKLPPDSTWFPRRFRKSKGGSSVSVRRISGRGTRQKRSVWPRRNVRARCW